MRNFFRRRRNFIVKEADLTDALKILDRRNLCVAGCNIGALHGYEKGNWVISVRVTASEWAYIERELRRIEITWH